MKKILSLLFSVLIFLIPLAIADEWDEFDAVASSSSDEEGNDSPEANRRAPSDVSEGETENLARSDSDISDFASPSAPPSEQATAETLPKRAPQNAPDLSTSSSLPAEGGQLVNLNYSRLDSRIARIERELASLEQENRSQEQQIRNVERKIEDLSRRVD